MQIYNRKKAVEYAHFWYNKRNPSYYNFDNLGGDCTNFISQCLFAGGYVMNLNVENGWFYKSLNYRSSSFTGVNEFCSFALNNKTNLGIKAKLVEINQLEIGDVVQLKQNDFRFNHSLLVTKIDRDFTNDNNSQFVNAKNIYVTTHTFDVVDKKLALYPYNEIRFLKMIT